MILNALKRLGKGKPSRLPMPHRQSFSGKPKGVNKVVPSIDSFFLSILRLFRENPRLMQQRRYQRREGFAMGRHQPDDVMR